MLVVCVCHAHLSTLTVVAKSDANLVFGSSFYRARGTSTQCEARSGPVSAGRSKANLRDCSVMRVPWVLSILIEKKVHCGGSTARNQSSSDAVVGNVPVRADLRPLPGHGSTQRVRTDDPRSTSHSTANRRAFPFLFRSGFARRRRHDPAGTDRHS